MIFKLEMSKKQCKRATDEAKLLESLANSTKNNSESQGFYVKEKIEEGQEVIKEDLVTANEVELVCY